MISLITNKGTQMREPNASSLSYMDLYMNYLARLPENSVLGLYLMGKRLPLETWKESVHCSTSTTLAGRRQLSWPVDEGILGSVTQ